MPVDACRKIAASAKAILRKQNPRVLTSGQAFRDVRQEAVRLSSSDCDVEETPGPDESVSLAVAFSTKETSVSPLLVDLLRRVGEVEREGSVLDSGDEDDGPFETLRRVDGREDDLLLIPRWVRQQNGRRAESVETRHTGTLPSLVAD